MRRIFGLTGFALTLGLSVYLFEWQNIGSFNGDRIELLRFLFYGSLSAAAIAALVGKRPWLPAALVALAFVLTAAVSRAAVDARALTIAAVFVVAAFACSAILRPPLISSRS